MNGITLLNETKPKKILLKDYKKPNFLIPSCELSFQLADENTIVSSKLNIVRNSDENNKNAPLVLNGEHMKLLSVTLDGVLLDSSKYEVDNKFLTIPNVPNQFLLEISNEINPKNNTALDGLYKSGDIFCTQNEPLGFRRISYSLDRSDVMSKYTTTVIADKKLYPILLSNGNAIDRGDLDDGKHFVTWKDPFPKPSYLFALVAGDLGMIQDSFTTRSKKEVSLQIFCDKGNEEKCGHAMESLKKSMKWDEEVFGLEYDLDIFMIVAVDAFNMGAMENKGLNIFNTGCILANPKTATDANFERIEKVVAHEYFHNWTGNRVTCRDWFQLTLKEGLTVFRDQEFSADMNVRSVQRIQDVINLRSEQFPEDAGPMSHPIKPDSYIQINNFYTSTVYCKGAEVIRMIHTLIGKEAFRKGIDTYFELYDGQAVTTEDFVHTMELASKKDLSLFKNWYSQSGTPLVTIHFNYHHKKQTLEITVEQKCPPTPDQNTKQPFHFPLSIGLLDQKGKDMAIQLNEQKGTTICLNVTQKKEIFEISNVYEQPIASVNRNFSAPVKIQAPYTRKDYMFLMAHDSDDFNRFEASRELAKSIMNELIEKEEDKTLLKIDEGYLDTFKTLLENKNLDHALKAKAMILPDEASLINEQQVIDFHATHEAREFVYRQIAQKYQDQLLSLYEELHDTGDYRIDPESIGKRSLKNACLNYLVKSKEKQMIALAFKQFQEANNMTDEFAALFILANIDCEEKDKALVLFYDKWKEDTLVMNKWLAVQAISKLSNTLERVRSLMCDPIFDISIPNLVKALLGSFISNLIVFHNKNGKGYSFIADKIIELDTLNPQIASGLCSAFKYYAKVDAMRKTMMNKEMVKILGKKDLSNNVYEIISKTIHPDGR